MDAHEMYLRYLGGQLPNDDVIQNILREGSIEKLELATLMYKADKQKIRYDSVIADKSLGQAYQHMLAKSSILQMDKDGGGGGGESKNGQPDEAMAQTQTEAITPPQKPIKKGPIGPKKGELNFDAVIECNRIFMEKSKTKIKNLEKLLNVQESMIWPKRSASKVECPNLTGQQLAKIQKSFKLLDGSDRFVHVSSREVVHFVNALSRNEVKTFSWDMGCKTVIDLVSMRKKIGKKLYATANNDDVVKFVIILCSIGLPLHQLMDPENFLVNWHSYRFKQLKSESVIRTLCKNMFPEETFEDDLLTPETEAQLFLRAYDKGKFTINNPKTAKEYMFRRWYWYPNRDELSTIVERANAILISARRL